MKADDAVGEQPDAVEKGIAAEQPADWRAGDSGRVAICANITAPAAQLNAPSKGAPTYFAILR